MHLERATDDKFFNSDVSLPNVIILIVDENPETLSEVAEMLKTYKNKDSPVTELTIETVRNPLQALTTIRMYEAINLVIVNLHMPEMDGTQLKQLIDQDFDHLPVVVMSEDDNDNVILEALACGFVAYIVKPLKTNDLEVIWYYATYESKKKTSVVVNELESIRHSLPYFEKIASNESNSSSNADPTEVENDPKVEKVKKRKASEKNDDEVNEEYHMNLLTFKKNKVVWTGPLHACFLEALKSLGVDKAVPKRILQFMDVPGLRREHVASHLQKYRLYLKNVMENGLDPSEPSHETSIALDLISRRSDSPHKLFKSPGFEVPNYDSYFSPSNKTMPDRVGYGLSNQLSRDYRSLIRSPILGMTNPRYYQSNHALFGIESTGIRPNLSPGINTPSIPDAFSQMPMFENQNVANNGGFYGCINPFSGYNGGIMASMNHSSSTPGMFNRLINNNSYSSNPNTCIASNSAGNGMSKNRGLGIGIGQNIDGFNGSLGFENRMNSHNRMSSTDMTRDLDIGIGQNVEGFDGRLGFGNRISHNTLSSTDMTRGHGIGIGQHVEDFSGSLGFGNQISHNRLSSTNISQGLGIGIEQNVEGFNGGLGFGNQISHSKLSSTNMSRGLGIGIEQNVEGFNGNLGFGKQISHNGMRSTDMSPSSILLADQNVDNASIPDGVQPVFSNSSQIKGTTSAELPRVSSEMQSDKDKEDACFWELAALANIRVEDILLDSTTDQSSRNQNVGCEDRMRQDLLGGSSGNETVEMDQSLFQVQSDDVLELRHALVCEDYE